MASLTELVKNKNVEAIKLHMQEHNLRIEGNKIVPNDTATATRLKGEALFWNQRQQARKILLG